MKMKHFLILFLCIICFSSHSKAEKKKILVLHSYHQGLNWTDNITKGMQSVFNKYGNLEVQYEYMDSKRNSGAAYLEEFAKLYEFKHHDIPFEVIIASDNNALEFVRKYQDKFFKNIPIVFSSIDQFNSSLIEGMKNVTGVTEYIDFKRTIEEALRLHPYVKNLVVINDNKTTSAIINRDHIKAFWPQLKTNVNLLFLENLSIEELVYKVRALDKSNIILLINFSQDKDGNYISYQENIDLIRKATNLPIYSSWKFYLNEGIVGGMLTCGFTQGELAAEIGMRVVGGEDINKIPLVNSGYNSLIFDYNQMKRFGIKSKDLPKGCEIINVPLSFMQKYKTYISITLLFIVIMVIIIIYAIHKRKTNEANLLSINKELDRRVEERTKELQLANDQLLLKKEHIRQQKSEIAQRKLLEEQSKRTERKILNAVIKAEEGERKRFAKDLHDSIGPLLASINLYLSALLDAKTDERKKEILKVSREAVNETIVSIKEISNNLSPHILNDFGLVKAIDSFANKLSLTESIDIIFNTENMEVRLNEQVEVVCYRVLTELIHNTIKHAGATNIEINLSREDDMLNLIYLDDGLGFDSKEHMTETSTGMGLYNILSRVRSLNGKHKIKSSLKQGGMMAVINIPLC
ncbi:MAG: ABC transporter substrate binding protein [Marinifilaceae bacterium]